MREILTISVGQCGQNIGLKYWEMICNEHGIMSNGTFVGASDLQLQKVGVAFHETKNGRFVPRATLVDLDSISLNEVQNNKFGELFNPNNFISSSGSANNNYAKGYYSDGPDILDSILEIIRKETEECENLQTFQLFNSVSGGTGSGVGTLIFNKLKEEFPDKILFSGSVLPSPKFSEVVTESYNAMLSISHYMEVANIVNTYENEALCSLYLRLLSITSPTYGDFNHLISLTLTSISSNLRFPGQLNSDFRKICVNLVPYPKFIFTISSFAPIALKRSRNCLHMLHGVTNQAFDCHNLMSCCDPRKGKYIAISAMYRGKVSMCDLENEILNFQNKNSSFFIDWIPSNIKVSNCEISPDGMKLAMTCLGNNTAIADTFNRITDHYAFMFRRKAFLHWYTSEGAEEIEFHLAEDNILDLIDDYQRIGEEINVEV